MLWLGKIFLDLALMFDYNIFLSYLFIISSLKWYNIYVYFHCMKWNVAVTYIIQIVNYYDKGQINDSSQE